ncbi:zinc finger protein 135-like [Anguilla anguilla]|uniref:zinc finger protein 135-like n=1 Tax=Anguilla anguilla TaxID=7936 RepID=UPI0015B1F2C4|nr:zinc finger protein 135-like [Anguilla anguilla]XP_035255773.1 zinc finger protein 135-like [Anguilla anguilla]
MEIEYVTIGLDPQVTEYIVEEADVETSFSPTHVKFEHDQYFNECNSEVPCPTLATQQFKLEPHSGTYELTDVYLDQNSQVTAQAETCHEQVIYIAKEGQPAEVLYQIKDETEESDSDVSGCGWFQSAPTEVGLANVGLLLGESGVQAGFEFYVCTECGKTFRGKESVLEHLQSHAQDGSHTCIQCKEKFPDSGSLLRHVQCEHTHNEEFHCSLCGMRFQAAKAYARHMRVHSGDKLFVCPDCGKNFRHRSSLSRHQQKHRHKPEEEEDSLTRCGFSRSNSTSSISSSSSSSSTSSSTSNSSNRTIPSPTPLPKLVIHGRQKKTAPKSFLCVKCGKRFNHSSSLSRHRLTHQEDKKPLPSISTELKSSPKQPSAQRGKPFTCAHCDKCFAHSSSFYKHVQTHEHMPYQCSLCHKGFLKLAALNSHQKCHQGRKRRQDRKVHSCFECGKSFNHSSSLSRHRHTH